MYLQVSECESTNSLLMGMERRVDYVCADYQTAGRGQAGNGWESERGMNILLSIAVERPKIAVADQFRLSMLFPLVVVETLGLEQLTIKWPNDIYYADRKLAGILIEHTVDSHGIVFSVLGIGLNVNQMTWQGSAPNPTSLRLITGHEWDRRALVEQLVKNWQQALSRLQDADQLHRDYMARLYRREGFWPYLEREVSTVPTMNAEPNAVGQFMARIKDVLPSGEILLEDEQGKERKYHFKQVRYVV